MKVVIIPLFIGCLLLSGCGELSSIHTGDIIDNRYVVIEKDPFPPMLKLVDKDNRKQYHGYFEDGILHISEMKHAELYNGIIYTEGHRIL
jgi:hypothetical protein